MPAYGDSAMSSLKATRTFPAKAGTAPPKFDCRRREQSIHGRRVRLLRLIRTETRTPDCGGYDTYAVPSATSPLQVDRCHSDPFRCLIGRRCYDVDGDA
jgi:hypothetical protein